jgi:hypothetical protein
MKANGYGSQLDRLKIEVSPGQRGGRLVVATLGGREYRNRLDTDNAFQRRKCREDIVDEFELPEDAHEFVERQLLAKADEADAEPPALWLGNVVCAAKVKTVTVEWLNGGLGYFPAGALCGIDGDPGLGKSQMTLDIAARVTRGDRMPPDSAPNGTYPPRGVLISNAEDDPACVIVPRLKAAGADLARVQILRSMRSELEADDRPVKLPYDLPAIENIIRANDVALWIVDPWVAYLDGELNVNNDADVRRCLGQMATLAETTRASILLVRHLNKKSGLSAIYRGGGSIGITGACRAVFMVGKDPADADSRIFAAVKNNLSVEPASLRFSIESFGDTSRVRWGDACQVSAGECLDAAHKASGGKVDAAKAIIVDILCNGPRGSSEVEGAIKAAGISESSYRRARSLLKVQSEKTGFNDGQWLLSLPVEESESW